MNVVKFDDWAFIFPDDMEGFRRRYGADVIFIDSEGAILVIGPGDDDWREIPGEPGHVVSIKGVSK